MHEGNISDIAALKSGFIGHWQAVALYQWSFGRGRHKSTGGLRCENCLFVDTFASRRIRTDHRHRLQYK